MWYGNPANESIFKKLLLFRVFLVHCWMKPSNNLIDYGPLKERERGMCFD